MSNPELRRRKGRPGAIAVVIWLAIVVVAVMIIGNTVFAVQRISVEGNSTVSDDEVIRASGITYQMSLFSVDAKAVREGINGNRYLEFVSLWRDFPDHVILRVTERSPRATLTWMGMLIILDDDGVVLEQMSNIDILLNVPTVTGMQIDVARLGFPVVSAVPGQEEAMSAVLSELSWQNMTADISELNVASLDNLYLVTVDGLQAMLGNLERLEDKINLLKAFLLEERPNGPVRNYVLDISSGIYGDCKFPQPVETVTAVGPAVTPVPTDEPPEEGL